MIKLKNYKFISLIILGFLLTTLFFPVTICENNDKILFQKHKHQQIESVNETEINFILHGTIVTMETNNGIIQDGYLLIRNGLIEEIWAGGETPPDDIDDVCIIETNGYIFPGLIDGHNHLYYNMIPLWSVPKKYSNRYEWQASSEYPIDIKNPKEIVVEAEYADLKVEVVKYSEIKALIGGTTAIQGAPSDWSAYTELLIRNIEHTNFGKDNIITEVSSVDLWDEGYILDLFNAKDLDALFGHIGEGTDELSHNEFKVLKNKGLLIEPLVAIHSLAFDRDDFSEMAEMGAKMIWSPTSNLLLYGETADVKAAWNEGVCIGLAPDWAPSGTKNVLGELKIADQWNKNKLNGFFSDYNLTEMVTTNPARMCGWESKVGKIIEGYYADLLVINKYNTEFDPYRSLINAIDFDVTLVVVNGDPLYGLVDYLELLKPDDFEIIHFHNWQRAIDITKNSVYMGDQLFSDIKQTLEQVMTFEPEILYDYFDKTHMSLEEFTDWLNDHFPGLHHIPLDPIETFGDTLFFDSINTSNNLNSNFSCNLYQYYDRKPGDNTPPDVPLIVGPKTGKTGVNYTFTISSTDLDNDKISYYIDWGDGTMTEWTDYKKSGDQLNISHVWNTIGSYTLKVKAKDTLDSESDWSYSKIMMPRIGLYTHRIRSILGDIPFSFPLILKILQF